MLLLVSEQVQILYYSIKKPYSKMGHILFSGNRIATWLIYGTEVVQGGSTVFVEPGIAVKPVKRAAVF